MPGMKSVVDIDYTFSLVLNELNDFIDIALATKPQIKNLVCSSSFGHPLDLNSIYVSLINENEYVSYEPEQFPGLIYKTELCTYNIFKGGKFIILGCTSLMDAEFAESSIIQRVGKMF